ncbi:erythromycin esterase family protein [Nonomuraea roseoviolacea]|nr:erythromycin esterase family protein [Nonomuraea roseoviolacea]
MTTPSSTPALPYRCPSPCIAPSERRATHHAFEHHRPKRDRRLVRPTRGAPHHAGPRRLPADLSVRDRYMAETVRWHLARSAPGTRMVLAAHNNHIQKHPVGFVGDE